MARCCICDYCPDTESLFYDSLTIPHSHMHVKERKDGKEYCSNCARAIQQDFDDLDEEMKYFYEPFRETI